tara:strand:- start:368 stop:517 length:150 start_codon:yes stop_codon:yes gene_type:complete
MKSNYDLFLSELQSSLKAAAYAVLIIVGISLTFSYTYFAINPTTEENVD